MARNTSPSHWTDPKPMSSNPAGSPTSSQRMPSDEFQIQPVEILPTWEAPTATNRSSASTTSEMLPGPSSSMGVQASGSTGIGVGDGGGVPPVPMFGSGIAPTGA